MILNNDQVIDILRALQDRTIQRKVPWHHEGGKLWVDLPNRVTVEISQSTDAGVSASVKGAAGEILGQIDFPRAEPGPHASDLRALYEAASGQAARSIYAEIIDSIKLADPVTVDVSMVGSVPPEQAEQVLKRMTGRWHLDYSRGKEQATIREDGAYILSGQAEPRFFLKVIAWNAKTSTAEIAKDKPDGKRFQIEYLAITPDAMTGHAKHDGHKLVYARMKS